MRDTTALNGVVLSGLADEAADDIESQIKALSNSDGERSNSG